jgi:hypothetical protein
MKGVKVAPSRSAVFLRERGVYGNNTIIQGATTGWKREEGGEGGERESV